MTTKNVERMIQYRLGRILSISQSPNLDPWLISYEAERLVKVYRELDVAQALAAQGVSA